MFKWRSKDVQVAFIWVFKSLTEHLFEFKLLLQTIAAPEQH